MKLVSCNIDEIKGMGFYKKSQNYRILSEFINGGLDCTEVVEYTNRTAGQCATSLNNSIKRYHMGNIRAISRKGKVYLIREEK